MRRKQVRKYTPHNYTTAKHTKKRLPLSGPFNIYHTITNKWSQGFFRTPLSQMVNSHIYIHTYNYMQKKKEKNWSLVFLIPENLMEFSSFYAKCWCKLQSQVYNVLNSSQTKGGLGCGAGGLICILPSGRSTVRMTVTIRPVSGLIFPRSIFPLEETSSCHKHRGKPAAFSSSKLHAMSALSSSNVHIFRAHYYASN